MAKGTNYDLQNITHKTKDLGLDYSMLSNHLVELLKTVYVSEVKKDQFKWKFKKNEMISFMSIDRKKLLHNN
jgi:hypothetical protein